MKELVAELIRTGNTAALQALDAEIKSPDGCGWRQIVLTKNGDTPCMLACRFGRVEVLQLFSSIDLERGNLEGKRPLHEAAQAGHILCVQYLLDHHIQVDCLKRADWTPLMLACTRDNINVVQCLLQAGASPSLCNKDGWTSLHIAAREGNTDIMRLLLSADPSSYLTVSNNGRSPLHTAALHGRLSAVELLLEQDRYHDNCFRNADSSTLRDNCGSTPLMDALRADHVEVAGLLQQHLHHPHISLNAIDGSGRLALHISAQTGALNSIRYLIVDCNTDPSLSAPVSCDTPIHCAARDGQIEAVKLLLELRADPSHINAKGRTACDVARLNGHEECARLLEQHVNCFNDNGVDIT